MSLDALAKVLSIISVIIGLITIAVTAIKRRAKEKEDLEALKQDMEQDREHTIAVRRSCHEEQTLIIYGLLACLKGLKEQGCDGAVTIAISEIEKHINKKAHE